MSVGLSRRVRVMVRTRPTANFAHDMIHLEEDGKTVSVHLPKNSDQLQGFINNQQQDWSFRLDQVLHNVSQEEVYGVCGREVVSRLMEGYNGTIMAYGETGAGKTYTMTGATENYRLRGIIPRTIAQVFQEARERQESSITVRISYLEIYNEAMYDLLSTLPDSPSTHTSSHPTLTISEDDRGGVFVKGLTMRLANNEEEALSMLFEGETNRSIAEHSLNKHSSRSHCIFTIHIESRSRTHSSAEYTVSKLNLVDLAGSERLSKTNSTGTIQREAMYINRSLSFLEQVIIALANSKRTHIPYRQSRLTHTLKDSLGGNCNTLMIANIWAEAAQIEETLSTLRFATRMMCVSNEPVQNVLQDPRLLVRRYEQEIRALKQELAMHDTLASRGSVSYDPLSEGRVGEIRRHVEQFVDGTIPEIEIVNVRQIKEVFAQFKALIQFLEQHGPDQPPRVVEEAGSSKTKPSSPLLTSKQPAHRGKTQLGKLAPPPPPPATVVEPEGDLVGDSDGTGFGIGLAPSSLKHPASPVAAMRKAKAVGKQTSEIRKRESKPGIAKSSNSPVPLPSEANEQGQEGKPPSESETRPSTPPPRAEVFEQFKRERGSEINKIFRENKESLLRKKKEALDLSTAINELKRKIDQLRGYLSDRQREREEELGGAITMETGETILDEQEYHTLSQLKQLKAQYREQYELLQSVQLEVQYCRQYVDQSRSRLLGEFESWYRVAFLGEGGEERAGEREGGKTPPEYDHEKFDRLQAALLKEDPARVAFYNAQLRTERRANEAINKRRPGQLSSSVRNRPPGIMAFS